MRPPHLCLLFALPAADGFAAPPTRGARVINKSNSQRRIPGRTWATEPTAAGDGKPVDLSSTPADGTAVTTTAAGAAPGADTLKEKVLRVITSKPMELGFYLVLWYALNAAFNVSNKLVLNQFPYPWFVSWVQLATGLLFVLPMWASGLRIAPVVDKKILLAFLPVALLHSSGHASQVAAMGLGTVFFTHIIKASEPFIGTLVVLVAKGKIAPWYVNLCLLPVVGGVAYAASKPGVGFFSASALWSLPSLLALASTVAFAIAKLLAKDLMSPQMKKERNLFAANNYALLTCCSATVLAGPSLLAEGPQAMAALKDMGPAALPFIKELLVCGGFYYAYNEMGFRVLDLLGPVSQAVANSLKRVVILFAAVVFLGETVTSRKLVGSCVAIGGVTLYSLAKAVAAKKQMAAADKAGRQREKKVLEVTIVEDTKPAGTWQP